MILIFNHKLHFLDSNILLNKVISYQDEEYWCYLYFKEDSFSKITSIRVYKECGGVLNKHRRYVRKYLFYIKKILNNKNNRIITTESIKQSFNDDIREDDDFTQNEKNQIFNLVESITKSFSLEIKDLIEDYSEDKFKKYDEDIKNIFKQAIEVLNLICKKQVSLFEENLFQKNESKYHGNLLKIGIHKPDNQHVLDCCSLSKYYEEDLAFITDDTGILEHKYEINKMLGICIFRPKNYYTDNTHRYL